MSKYSLNADNFLRTLPEVLQDDPRMQALPSRMIVTASQISRICCRWWVLMTME